MQTAEHTPGKLTAAIYKYGKRIRHSYAEKIQHDVHSFKGDIDSINIYLSETANELAESDAHLVVTPKQPGNQRWLEVGEKLRKGTIVVHGDANKVSGLEGGTVFVEGSTNTVHLNNLLVDSVGIVYIRKNLKLLEAKTNDVVIVAGILRKYILQNNPLDYYLFMPPFIFT
jgi:hypothetical protein